MIIQSSYDLFEKFDSHFVLVASPSDNAKYKNYNAHHPNCESTIISLIIWRVGHFENRGEHHNKEDDNWENDNSIAHSDWLEEFCWMIDVIEEVIDVL